MVSTIGRLIKEYRWNHALSQAEFAEKANVSPSMVSVIENSVSYNPKMPTISKLAKALDLSVDDFLKLANL